MSRTINQALTRPETVAGVEKGPLGIVVGSGIGLGLMGWIFMNPVAVVACVALLFGGVPLLRRIAKADKQMFAIYLANFRLRDHYSARTPGHVAEPEVGARRSHAGTAVTIGVLLIGTGFIFSMPKLTLAGGIALLAAPLAAWFARRQEG